MIISIFSWFLISNSFLKFFNHIASFLASTERYQILPKNFSILQHHASYIYIFLLPNSVHCKVPFINLEHSVLFKPIYSLFVYPNFWCICSHPLLQISIATFNVFNKILFFFSNLSHCLVILVYSLLTLSVSIPNEEKKLNFYFHTSLRCRKRFLKAFILIQLSEIHGAGRVNCF